MRFRSERAVLSQVRFCLTLVFLDLVLGQVACIHPLVSPVNPVQYLDLSDMLRLEPALSAQGGGEEAFRKHILVTRKGETKSAVVLIAPVAVSASVPGLAGAAILECMTAPVFNVGDGFQLVITLSTKGKRETLYGRYYDPGRNADDRAWIALSVPLNLGRAGDAQLGFQLSGGPQGDLVADWLAIASARLVQTEARPQKTL
jgi:hypothetical protein